MLEDDFGFSHQLDAVKDVNPLSPQQMYPRDYPRGHLLNIFNYQFYKCVFVAHNSQKSPILYTHFLFNCPQPYQLVHMEYLLNSLFQVRW